MTTLLAQECKILYILKKQNSKVMAQTADELSKILLQNYITIFRIVFAILRVFEFYLLLIIKR